MLTTFNNLLAAIYKNWPDLTVMQYKSQVDMYGQCRFVINTSPAKALQLSFWKQELIQVDILPECCERDGIKQEPYAQFELGGAGFTNQGGHCFIFQREPKLNLLNGEDVYDAENRRHQSCTDGNFIDLILKAISK